MTDGTVQGFRRTARENATQALALIQGRPGLKLKEQQANLEQAATLLGDASVALSDAFDAVQGRRNAKKAAKANA
jgi:hypothetical protein